MKRILTIATALMLTVSAFAQQALWGGPNVESPVINPDGTVTFRYRAPKAVKVQVTGDFLPTQKLVFEMNGNKIRELLREALTDKIDDRETFMKGINYSYYYEQEE